MRGSQRGQILAGCHSLCQCPQTETYNYDLLGNLTRAVDEIGRIVEYAYDNLSRLVSENWLAADGITVEYLISYTYDLLGRRTELAAGD